MTRRQKWILILVFLIGFAIFAAGLLLLWAPLQLDWH